MRVSLSVEHLNHDETDHAHTEQAREEERCEDEEGFDVVFHVSSVVFVVCVVKSFLVPVGRGLKVALGDLCCLPVRLCDADVTGGDDLV